MDAPENGVVMKRAIIKQVEGDEIPTEIIATHIAALARMGKNIKASRLKEKTMLVLLNHMTSVPQKEIKKILDALPQLEKQYLK